MLIYVSYRSVVENGEGCRCVEGRVVRAVGMWYPMRDPDNADPGNADRLRGKAFRCFFAGAVSRYSCSRFTRKDRPSFF